MENDSNFSIYGCIQCTGQQAYANSSYTSFSCHVGSFHKDDLARLAAAGGDVKASGVEALLQCNACKKLFVTKEELKEHAITIHKTIYQPGRYEPLAIPTTSSLRET